jgi:hypothetical protein
MVAAQDIYSGDPWMTTLEHDSALALEVRWLPGSNGRHGARYRPHSAGWYVIRICPCHDGHIITRRFETETEAVGALIALEFGCATLFPEGGMIVDDKFPWQSHRTLAEVTETQVLRRLQRTIAWRNNNRWRLQTLEARACEPDRDPPPVVA